MLDLKAEKSHSRKINLPVVLSQTRTYKNCHNFREAVRKIRIRAFGLPDVDMPCNTHSGVRSTSILPGPFYTSRSKAGKGGCVNRTK